MKKKRLLVFLTAALLLSGCGSGGSDGSASSASSDAGSQDQEEVQGTEEAGQDQPVFEETVLADNENYKLTATGFSLSDDKYILTLKAENKRSNSMDFFHESTTVDGVIYFNGTKFTVPVSINSGPALSHAEVEPGDSGEIEISIETEDLKVLDIKEPSDIKLGFYINDPKVDDFYSDKITVHVYPRGEENASEYTVDPQYYQKVLTDTDGFTAALVSSEIDTEGNWTGYLYLQNHSGKSVSYSLNDSSVNGIPMDLMDFYYSIVYPGENAFLKLTYSSANSYGITSIDEIQFHFSAASFIEEEGEEGVGESQILCDDVYTITP